MQTIYMKWIYCAVHIYFYYPEGAKDKGNKQERANRLSRLDRPEYVTATYLVEHECLKGMSRSGRRCFHHYEVD